MIIATRCDGLPIYAFKYLWDDQVHVGVMAQDLLRNELWRPVVLTKEHGYFAVDYRRLGLRMTTFDAWQDKGMAALEHPGLYGEASSGSGVLGSSVDCYL